MLARRDSCLKGRAINSFDFKGFNEQHNSKHMIMLYEELLRWYQINFYDDPNLFDVLESLEWTIDSFKEMWIQYPDKEEPMKCEHTLLSGARGTTFINTFLNVAYIDLVKYNFSK